MRKKRNNKVTTEASLQLRLKSISTLKTVQCVTITKDTFDALCGRGAKDVVRYLKKHPHEVNRYTRKESTVLLVSDGSSVSGVGGVGPQAVLPLLESKAVLLAQLGGVHAVPLPITARNADDFAHIVKALTPSCCAVLLYGVSSPKCFEVIERLERECDVPVLDATLHGLAPVVLAGLINAHRVAKKDMRTSRVAILGAGATALSIARVLGAYGVGDIVVVDRDGILGPLRTNVEGIKERIALETNREGRTGGALEAITGADAVVSVSSSGPLTQEYVRMMAQRSIVFALRDPSPEISFTEANDAGALVCASRDALLPNFLSEALVLPHVLRSIREGGRVASDDSFLVYLGEALAHSVTLPSEKKIVPTVFDRKHAKQFLELLRLEYGA